MRKAIGVPLALVTAGAIGAGIAVASYEEIHHKHIVGTQAPRFIREAGFTAVHDINPQSPHFATIGELVLGHCSFNDASVEVVVNDGHVSTIKDMTITLGKIQRKPVKLGTYAGVTLHFVNAQQLEQELPGFDCEY